MNDEFQPTLTSAIEACTLAAPELRLSRAVTFKLRLFELDYYRLLGLHWSKAIYLWPLIRELRQDLEIASIDARFAMMSDAEFGVWDDLPDSFEVYRGCYWDNKDGLAWSLKPEVASEFPFMDGYRREASPMLAYGQARKLDCVVKLCDDRVDIISADIGVRAIEQLAPRTH